MLNVFKLRVFLQNALVLIVVILSAVMLNVVALLSSTN
jgi:hypothetical protein